MSRELEIVVTIVSVVLFVGTLVAVPWLLVRLPSDYFVRPRGRRSFGVRLARNVAGVVLVALGVAMLVLPGQGVLTILLGLALVDLPLKDRVLARVLRRKGVHDAIDSLRGKAGRPPLMVPDAA